MLILNVRVDADSSLVDSPYVFDLTFRFPPTYESLRYRVLSVCSRLALPCDLSVSITCSLDNFTDEIVFKYSSFSARCPLGRAGCSRILARWNLLSSTP